MYTFSPRTKIESAKVNSNFQELVDSLAITPPVGSIIAYGGSSAPTGYLICDGSTVSRTTYAALFAVFGTTYGAGNGSTTFTLPDARTRALIGSGAGSFTTTFAYTDVDTSTEIITVPSNTSLYTGTAVVLTTTGSLPTGLALATTYYVIRVSATTIKLASSLANAVAGSVINITAQGSGVNTITVTMTNNSLGVKGGEENHALVTAEIPAHIHNLDQGNGAVGSGNYSAPEVNAAYPNNYATNSTGGSGNHNNMPPHLVVNYIVKF